MFYPAAALRLRNTSGKNGRGSKDEKISGHYVVVRVDVKLTGERESLGPGVELRWQEIRLSSHGSQFGILDESTGDMLDFAVYETEDEAKNTADVLNRRSNSV